MDYFDHHDVVKSRIRDESPAARATALSAIRYTFAESSSSLDDLLGSVIMDFIGLISDADLVRLIHPLMNRDEC